MGFSILLQSRLVSEDLIQMLAAKNSLSDKENKKRLSGSTCSMQQEFCEIGVQVLPGLMQQLVQCDVEFVFWNGTTKTKFT